jgi:hypothetical protein
MSKLIPSYTETARRLLDSYGVVKAEYAEHSEEFSQLQSAIQDAKPGSLQDFQKAYEERGGEQFRPNSARVKCTSVFPPTYLIFITSMQILARLMC